MNYNKWFSELQIDRARMIQITKSMNFILLKAIVYLTYFIMSIILRYVLIYLILKQINADKITWILFWVGVPVFLVIDKVIEKFKDWEQRRESDRLMAVTENIKKKYDIN